MTEVCSRFSQHRAPPQTPAQLGAAGSWHSEGPRLFGPCGPLVVEDIAIPQVTQKDTLGRVSPFGLKMRGEIWCELTAHTHLKSKG